MIELNKSSIYQIRNIINNKIYVGSAINTRTRWGKHRHDLRKGVHKSKYLKILGTNMGKIILYLKLLNGL